jgi:release factor glutamine methyltransferase
VASQGRNLREALADTRRILASVGIEEARLEAEVLLINILGISRARLYAFQEQELTPQQEDTLATLLERRLAREPLAYILGHKEFFGLDLIVRPGVLIPRPETELLVEKALLLVVERYPEGGMTIADPGTGCGAIAISLAIHLPNARIYATEVSPEALQVAEENLQRYGVKDRVLLLAGDLLSPVPEPVDMVVANPPYVRSDELPTLQPEIQFEPREALDGGPDGLSVITRLLHQAAGRLRPGGTLLMEMDPRQVEPLRRLAEGALPGAAVRFERDLAGLDRYLVLETPR